jgi:hypothetical protein
MTTALRWSGFALKGVTNEMGHIAKGSKNEARSQGLRIASILQHCCYFSKGVARDVSEICLSDFVHVSM